MEWGHEGDISCSWACSTHLTRAGGLCHGPSSLQVAGDCTAMSACPWAGARPQTMTSEGERQTGLQDGGMRLREMHSLFTLKSWGGQGQLQLSEYKHGKECLPMELAWALGMESRFPHLLAVGSWTNNITLCFHFLIHKPGIIIAGCSSEGYWELIIQHVVSVIE